VSTDQITADVVVVGSGPAGLNAARSLKLAGVESVLVLERESVAGGVPRHCAHTGYGLRDLRTLMTGPEYARKLVERAQDAGAKISTSTMATGWDGDTALMVTSPAGRHRVEARAVILTTGARERPRAARWIPGDRPPGVLTTGQLQTLVHLKHESVGQRAVVVGSELVSWSAVMTLREAGCATALMTTVHDHPESYAAFSLTGRLALGVPVARSTEVVRIIGQDRVRAVEIRHLRTGKRRTFECDTVVFTGDWIPDHELARARGLDMDPGHKGPVVDSAMRTSERGIFAAGNVVHPVDTADVAALDGVHVAEQVRRFLDGDTDRVPGVRLLAAEPFRWVSPGILGPENVAPARSRILLWCNEFRRFPQIQITQDGRQLACRRMPWPMSPGRVFRIPSSLFDGVDPHGGDVVVGLK
jgi:thioredoxin reductase